MSIVHRRASWLLSLVLLASADAWAVENDLVLVVDNSGSMKQNDPRFLTQQAVGSFVQNLDATSRVALVIFDATARLEVPLIAAGDEARQAFEAGIAKLDFRGQHTNSPAAIERAIYELSFRGRDGVQKAIVFITDGIVDTGDPAADQEKARWMREGLTADARRAGVRIFSVAFSEGADFHLIQALAQETDGQYFRVLTADEIAPTFSRIIEAITATAPTVTEAPAQPSTSIPKAGAPVADADLPTVADWEETGDDLTQEMIDRRSGPADTIGMPTAPDSSNTVVWWGLAVLLLLSGGGTAVWWLWLRADNLVAADAAIPPAKSEVGKASPSDAPTGIAYLRDSGGITGEPLFDISTGTTIVGRVGGSQTKDVRYLVIPDPAVSRRHAVIEARSFAFWVTDQGSSNGTRVNGHRISEATQLKQGDVLSFHHHDFEFAMPDIEHADATRVMGSPMLANAAEATAKMDAADVAELIAADRDRPLGTAEEDMANLDLDQFADVDDSSGVPAGDVPDLGVTVISNAAELVGKGARPHADGEPPELVDLTATVVRRADELTAPPAPVASPKSSPPETPSRPTDRPPVDDEGDGLDETKMWGDRPD